MAVHSISKTYRTGQRQTLALRDVSIEVASGEILVLLRTQYGHHGIGPVAGGLLGTASTLRGHQPFGSC